MHTPKLESIYGLGSTTRDGVQVALLEKRIFQVTDDGQRKEIARAATEVPIAEIWQLIMG
jgi:hypothetical protein